MMGAGENYFIKKKQAILPKKAKRLYPSLPPQKCIQPGNLDLNQL